jgi:hypothetical protein
MSFFSSIGKALRTVASTAIQSFLPGPVGQIVASPLMPAVVAPTARAVAPLAGAAIQAFRAPSAPLGLMATQVAAKPFIGDRPGLDILGAACPAGWHLDKKTRSRCVRNRRMNPLNGRAATRAIRRIKGARKMLQKIERQLPRTRSRGSTRPARHITGPAHTE